MLPPERPDRVHGACLTKAFPKSPMSLRAQRGNLVPQSGCVPTRPINPTRLQSLRATHNDFGKALLPHAYPDCRGRSKFTWIHRMDMIELMRCSTSVQS